MKNVAFLFGIYMFEGAYNRIFEHVLNYPNYVIFGFAERYIEINHYFCSKLLRKIKI